jgi:MFS family permease
VATFTLLVLSGLGQSGFSTMQTSITLLAAPEEMRGRMMGLLSTCIGVANPIGALEIGAIASLFALHWSISLNAAAGLVLVLPAIALTPLVRQPLTQPPPAPVTP